MTPTRAPGELDHPALALVNTRWNNGGELVDELADPEVLLRWLAEHDATGGTRMRSAALGPLRALRDATRELLLARIEGRSPDAGALDAVNQASAAAPSAAQLVWLGSGDPRRTDAWSKNDPAASARARVARDAIELVTGPDHADLRACRAPGCVRLLLADHPRRCWCSKRCGDRVRAARYYRRHRASAAAPKR